MTVSGHEVRDRIRSGAQSAVEVCGEMLARIERIDPALHAFNTVTAEQALARASELDRNRDRWTAAPLFGVPIAVKDNLCTQGIRTTASSRMLESYLPPY